MSIQEWFDQDGSFEKGVALYALLPNAKNNLMRSFKVENFSNMLMLKYELKTALNRGVDVRIGKVKKVAPIVPIVVPEVKDQMPVEYLIQQTNKVEFAKETMAMYPVELHSVYRERVSNFYMACELKFQLNRIAPEDEKGALELILKIESLWSKIDKAWMVLGYWKENNRMMPIEQSQDFTKLSPMQLQKEKGLIEVRISKRNQTLLSMAKYVDENPMDKTKLNLFHKKTEELEQLKIDIETIKKLMNE